MMKKKVIVLLLFLNTVISYAQAYEIADKYWEEANAAAEQKDLMSLSQVPDKETAEFMEEFYQNLFDSKNIEKSFSDTQRYMKTKYPDDPYSWAAFVLLK